jgi:hypothetical protein
MTKNLRLALFLPFCVVASQLVIAQKTVKYDLPAFTEISLKNDAKLVLKQDSIQSVTVTAKQATLDKLVVEVVKRKLTIRYPAEAWFDSKWSPGDVEITIAMPQIDELSQSGSGSIVANQPINSRILDLYVGGSGVIRLSELKADKLSATLSGSGKIQLSGEGTVSEFKMILSGSGSIAASGLKSKQVDVIIAGSASCAVHALELLKCKIVGSGEVTYVGNPAIESSIVGSGKVKEGK